MDEHSFETVVRVLNDLEAKGYVKSYAIGGGVAAIFYAEPFFTEDIDILILVPEDRENSLDPLRDIYAFLRQCGYHPEGLYVRVEGDLVQFLVASDALFREALENGVKIMFGSSPTRILRAEHLLALMAAAGRPKDFVKMNLVLEGAVDLNYAELDDIIKRHNLTDQWARFERSRQ